jgi:hypothetical protein
MINKTVMDSNGNTRLLQGKIFGKQLRIYRVYGDVTDIEALKETAQILALQMNVDEVLYTNI